MQKFLDWCDSREGQIAAVRLILVLALIGLGIVLGRMFPSHKKADPDIVKISSEVEGLKIYAIKASETSAHIIISGPGGVVTKTITKEQLMGKDIKAIEEQIARGELPDL